MDVVFEASHRNCVGDQRRFADERDTVALPRRLRERESELAGPASIQSGESRDEAGGDSANVEDVNTGGDRSPPAFP